MLILQMNGRKKKEELYSRRFSLPVDLITSRCLPSQGRLEKGHYLFLKMSGESVIKEK